MSELNLDELEKKYGPTFDGLHEQLIGELREGRADKTRLIETLDVQKDTIESLRGRLLSLEKERDNFKKWYDAGMKCAQSFFEKEIKSHIVDAICLIGWERDRLRNKVKYEKLVADAAVNVCTRLSGLLKDALDDIQSGPEDRINYPLAKRIEKQLNPIHHVEVSPDRQHFTPDTDRG